MTIHITTFLVIILVAVGTGFVLAIINTETNIPQNHFEMQLDIFRSRLERLEELLKKRKK